MAFGVEIKRLKDLSGLSAQAFADIMGIEAPRLRKWMEKDLNPKYEDVQKIESFFGMTLEQIMKLEQIPSTLLNSLNKPYHQKRNEQKLNSENEAIPYYDVTAHAADPQIIELLPARNPEKLLYVKDLFKHSEYAIRVSGNSMVPNYPAGSVMGLRQIF